MVKYLASGRVLQEGDPDAINTLIKHYKYVRLSKQNLVSVYGSLNKKLRLYGGRYYDQKYTIDDKILAQLKENNIGFELVLSNHYFNQEAYEQARPQIERINYGSNGVICLNDDLARAIRKDFPNIHLRKSGIEKNETASEVNKLLELYDSVALWYSWNVKLDELKKIKDKSRVVLFANDRCGETCPSRSCFVEVSNHFMYDAPRVEVDECPNCKNRDVKSRLYKLDQFVELGFTTFKVFPTDPRVVRRAVKDFVNKVILQKKYGSDDLYNDGKNG